MSTSLWVRANYSSRDRNLLYELLISKLIAQFFPGVIVAPGPIRNTPWIDFGAFQSNFKNGPKYAHYWKSKVGPFTKHNGARAMKLDRKINLIHT